MTVNSKISISKNQIDSTNNCICQQPTQYFSKSGMKRLDILCPELGFEECLMLCMPQPLPTLSLFFHLFVFHAISLTLLLVHSLLPYNHIIPLICISPPMSSPQAHFLISPSVFTPVQFHSLPTRLSSVFAQRASGVESWFA